MLKTIKGYFFAIIISFVIGGISAFIGTFLWTKGKAEKLNRTINKLEYTNKELEGNIVELTTRVDNADKLNRELKSRTNTVKELNTKTINTITDAESINNEVIKGLRELLKDD